LQQILTGQEHVTAYKTVNVFLSSMLRNSLKSKYAYQYGLSHFQKFLKQKHHEYNIETILKQLLKNKLDVYVILDEFVSYLVDAALELTSNSIKLYISAVRSYLAY
jgi:hypothetical protein